MRLQLVTEKKRRLFLKIEHVFINNQRLYNALAIQYQADGTVVAAENIRID